MIDLNQYLTGASPYDGAVALKYDDGDYSLETIPPSVPYTNNDKQHTVMDGETLIGFISIGDLVKAAMEDQHKLIEQLQQYISG